MSFDNQKKNCLTKIDKSKKKSIDKDIKPLVDLLNSLNDYYTTSSCSGRILLIEKKSDKKQDARFVFAEHKKADFKKIKQSLKKLPKNDLWLKQESIIMHVCCRNIESAKKLLKIVRDLGIKRAGIINIDKRIIIEIIGTESMETIIAMNGKILIDDDYLKILVKETNQKLERNKKKIKELYREIKKFNDKFIKNNQLLENIMTTETITIPKEEYLKLKKLEEVDHSLLNQLVSSLEDIKAGRIRRVR